MNKLPFSKEKKGGASSATSVSGGDIVYTINTTKARSNLERLQAKSEVAKFDAKKHKDTKRSQIALVFVWGYIAMITIIIVGGPLYNALLVPLPEPIDIERILSQIGALIGSPLGFVIGYYFKEDK